MEMNVCCSKPDKKTDMLLVSSGKCVVVCPWYNPFCSQIPCTCTLVKVENYRCTWPQWETHMHTVGLPGEATGPSQRPLPTQCGKNITDIRAPRGISLYNFVLCFYFIRTCFVVLIVLYFAFLTLLTPHNTIIHAPGGILTPKPNKRSAGDPRLRPLGHWNR
jgi:hypothetical protein